MVPPLGAPEVARPTSPVPFYRLKMSGDQTMFSFLSRGAVCGLGLTAAALLSSTALARSIAPAGTMRAGVTAVGASDSTRVISLALHLPSRDEAGLKTFLAHLTLPGDALYRHYLTQDEFAARFGADEHDYAAIVAWAAANGLTVGEHFTARTIVPISGTIAAMSQALGTSFSDYRDSAGHVFAAATSAAHLPAEIASRVQSVIGLNAQTGFAPMLRILPRGVHTSARGSGPGGGYTAYDLRQLYSVPKQGFGPAQTVAVFEQGGFTPSDVTTYLMQNKLPMVPVKVRPVDKYNGSVNSADVEAEAVLDIDMAIGLNPALSQVLVYEQGTASFPVALVDSLSAMASDDSAKVISISYGTDEAIQGTDAINAENAVLEQLTGQGQTVFASTGDDGAYGRSGDGQLNVADPSTQPFVTAVGGTTLFSGPKHTYQAEEVWNDLGAGYGATGGGVSTVWPIPAFQTPGGYMVTTGNGGSSTMRNVPDVAAVANPLTGVSIYSALNGGWIVIGGTSVSAPIWGGYFSVVNGISEGLGFGVEGYANPAFYYIANFRTGPAYTMFNDITDGTNGETSYFVPPGFSAGLNYDNTTGWGTLLGSALLTDLVVPLGNAAPPPAPTILDATPHATSIRLTWSRSAHATGYLVQGTNDNTGEPTLPAVVGRRSFELTGLAPDSQYYITITAISPGGTTMSQPVVVTTTN
jgi:kumamolisin